MINDKQNKTKKKFAYESLRYIDTNSHNICSWWIHSYNDYKYSRKNRVVVKILLNVYSYEKRQCPLCEEYVTNDIPHVLCSCDSIKNERKCYWNRGLMCAPYETILPIDKMNDVKKTDFIVNAYHCKYVPECKMIFYSLSDFIYNMYLIYGKDIYGELSMSLYGSVNM